MRGLFRAGLWLVAILLAGAAAYDYSKIGRVSPARVAAAERADLVIVDKARRELRLMRGDAVIQSYRVALGGRPEGHKQQEGDRRTPEGRYRIDGLNPRSAFHLGLHLSYPNVADASSARARNVSPGGDIMIHGLPNGLALLGPLHRLLDWTNGCVAVTNDEIEDIWRYLDVGTPVLVNP